MRHRRWLVPLVIAARTSLGCSRAEPEPTAAPTSKGSLPSAPSPVVLAPRVRLIRARTGDDVAKVVREERDRARVDGRDLVVYVGAPWCEPCRYFHEAAASGGLDAELPALTLLEFNLDEDRERLASAGYVSQYVPLFAIPDTNGRASEKRFEGSVKGRAAVANIAPRLRALLAK